MEINYCNWLGMLDNPEHAPDISLSRAEHMQRKAMDLTLIYALVLEDYRQFRQLPRRWVNDEKLLVTMHEKRARSKYIPAAARMESERWLSAHPLGYARAGVVLTNVDSFCGWDVYDKGYRPDTLYPRDWSFPA